VRLDEVDEALPSGQEIVRRRQQGAMLVSSEQAVPALDHAAADAPDLIGAAIEAVTAQNWIIIKNREPANKCFISVKPARQ
jgi:hypothetical protein